MGMPPSPFTPVELRVLRGLDTPRKVQNFLDRIPKNFERGGDTCMSPRMVLAERRAHCIEGAMLAAAALRLQGRPPLLLDLEAAAPDFDHVIALFRERGRWGAISKTNYAVLRWREPVYRSVRELAMSYFHEYLTDDGKKTLRAFSRPVDLSRFDRLGWMTSEEDVWYVAEFLCDVPHEKILARGQAATLRRADQVEVRAGQIVEWRDRPLRRLKN